MIPAYRQLAGRRLRTAIGCCRFVTVETIRNPRITGAAEMSNIISSRVSTLGSRFTGGAAASPRPLKIRKPNKYRRRGGFLRLHAEVVAAVPARGDGCGLSTYRNFLPKSAA